MNKWEDSSKKNEVCQCSRNDGLFVPNRQLSLIVAGFLFLAFSVFMTGYFLGKKNVVEQFSDNIQQEAFADQVYTAVVTAEQDSEQKSVNTLLVTEADATNIIVEMPDQSANQENKQEIIVAENAEIENTTLQTSAIRYYAQLIGFGTEKAAQLFVNKLAAKGIETEIKKRTSKTVKGRPCCWYQVVTGTYSDKNDLVVLVDKIAKEENIKDASIRTC
jgi:cell division protein FtsN